MASRRPNPYDYHWRRHDCPPVLKAAGGTVDRRGRYTGLARCLNCKNIEPAVVGRRLWQVAHLDGDPWNRAPWNLAVLCPACHRDHDAPVRSVRYRATRRRNYIRRKDASRTLLALLDATAEQAALAL